MSLYNLNEFLRLSSVLNYNLSAASLNRYNVLLFIIGDKRLREKDTEDREQKSIVMDALGYLYGAYRQKRRRLGPMAVIHPIRAAALFARSRDTLDLVTLLSALFHDILEDIRSNEFTPPEWKDLESQLYDIFRRLDPADEQRLTENLLDLTRVKGESYYHYIGRLLDNCRDSTEIVQIKLADRLDNTLDMRIDLRDPLEGIDFFENIFQIMFVRNYTGLEPTTIHPTSTVLNGAKRLYQLFKNAVLLTLIRQKIPEDQSAGFKDLFDAISTASLQEAQRTFVHLIHYHYRDTKKQRTLLQEAMEYCYSGRSDLVTVPGQEYLLDGLFSTYFGFTTKKTLDPKLDLLYQDKPLMIESSIAFITIFLSFLNDDRFYVQGITAHGIDPR